MMHISTVILCSGVHRMSQYASAPVLVLQPNCTIMRNPFTDCKCAAKVRK